MVSARILYCINANGIVVRHEYISFIWNSLKWKIHNEILILNWRKVSNENVIRWMRLFIISYSTQIFDWFGLEWKSVVRSDVFRRKLKQEKKEILFFSRLKHLFWKIISFRLKRSIQINYRYEINNIILSFYWTNISWWLDQYYRYNSFTFYWINNY